MFLRALTIFFSLLWVTVSRAGESFLEWQLRHAIRTANADTIEPGGLYRFSLSASWRAEVGGKLTLTPSYLEGWDYKGEMSFEPCRWLFLGLRLNHGDSLQDGFGLTQLSGRVRLALLPFQAVGMSLTGGWYESFTRVERAIPLLPALSGTRDRDFLVGLHLNVRPTATWGLSGGLATFDEFSVFRLNNPHLEAAIEYRPSPDWTWRLFGRYRFLLGFGHLDQWTTGIAVLIPRGPTGS